MVQPKHLACVASLLIVLSSVAAACGAATPAATPTPTPAAGGGKLRWAVEGVSDLPTLDPPLAGDSQSIGVAGLVFEGLVRLDRDLRVAPAGAESWEIKNGGKTFVFHIRPGLKFANGDPVSAEDFAYALNRAFSPALASGSAAYYLSNITGASLVAEGTAETISGVKVLDPLTLQIDLDTPATYFLDQLTFVAAYVVPRQAIEADPSHWTDHAYGTGPFQVKEWKHNSTITLVPNPHYWLGAPKLEAIELPFFQDAEVAFQAYQANTLDIMGAYNFPSAHIPDVANLVDFRQVNKFFVTYIGFNNTKPPFDDVRVRQAFAQAVDKNELVNTTLASAVIQADTLIPPGMPGFNKDAQVQTFNPAGAKQLLAEAGYPNGQGFPPIAFTINNENPDYATVAASLCQMWQVTLGVDVKVDTRELAQFNEDLTAMANQPGAPGALIFYLSVWGADYPDPQNFVSQQLRSGVANNNGHYSNAEFDRLVDQADVGAQAEERYRLYQQAEQIALDEVGWLPLYYGKTNLLLRPSVKGFVITPQNLVPKVDWTQVTVEP